MKFFEIKIKRIFATVLTLIMILLPINISLASVLDGKYEVVIHKLDVPEGTKTKEHDGRELSEKEIKDMSAKTLSGVTFAVWQLDDDADISKYDDKTNGEIIALMKSEGIKELGRTTKTDEKGITRVKLNRGRYVLAEVENENKVSGYVGVPILLELPQLTPDGLNWYGDISEGLAGPLHIYPKNVIDPTDPTDPTKPTEPPTTPTEPPSVDRQLVKDTKNGYSFNVGETIEWTVNFKYKENFTNLIFTDKLNEAFTDINKTTVKAGDNILTSDTDYKLSVLDNLITIELTNSGLEKANNSDNLNFDFSSNLNIKAPMCKKIPNFAEIEYGSDGELAGLSSSLSKIGEEKETLVNNTGSGNRKIKSNTVEVWTGGAKFIKVDDAGKSLANAEFVFLDGSSNEIKWTEELLNFNNKDFFVNPKVGESIKMKSNNDGNFEIKGFKDGKYFIKETKAPKDLGGKSYNLLKENYGFNITSESYCSDAMLNKIVNKRGTGSIQMPKTGSIVAGVLVVLGLSIMTYSILDSKKKKTKK